MGDVLDAPRRRAEREDVTDAGLVDHLLVELADPGAPLPGVAADQEHAEQAAVGDGAAAGDREPLRPRTGRELAGDAVPHQPRAQLGELVGGVATGEEVQHGVVRRARQAGERRGAADQVVEGVDVPRLHGGGGDELLGEHVERVGGHPHRLDRTGAHPLDGDGGLGEVAAMLGEEHAAGDLADLVAGAADALQGAGDAGRGLDLHDEVDRAHVDAELETAGGDHGGQAAALEVVLDEGALLLGDRAVVGAGEHRGGALAAPGLRHHLGRDLAGATGDHVTGLGLHAGALGGDLVEAGGEPLGQTPGVGEDDGGAVPLDEVGDPLLDVRPEAVVAAAALGVAGAVGVVEVLDAAGVGHVLDGDDDGQLPLLARGRGDDLDGGAAAEEAGDLLQRAHGGGETDALGGGLEHRVEPLEAEREVGAALGAGDGVHLVDDHRAHAAQRLPRLAGQHEEQRLGRGDEDVGRLGGEPAPVGGAGVTGADTDLDVVDARLQPLGGVADAGQRGTQVALDVDGQGLERADVEDAAALLRVLGRGVGEHLVQGPEKRAERLAAAGGGHDQCVLAGADRLPGTDLGRGGLGEGRAEPRPRRLAELLQHVGTTAHPLILSDGTDSPLA